MKNLSRNIIMAMLVALLLFSCASTKTNQDQYIETEGFVAQRDFASAAAVIEAAKTDSYKEKDRVLYYLDIGMLYHYAGEYAMSNEA
ncbi:MAG: hypothetical protein PF447_01435 [Spirochaetaceae bacterium]|jgi:hypothetical protein|nr:hypothetical protein [Spirochaetaceae bacterium]